TIISSYPFGERRTNAITDAAIPGWPVIRSTTASEIACTARRKRGSAGAGIAYVVSLMTLPYVTSCTTTVSAQLSPRCDTLPDTRYDTPRSFHGPYVIAPVVRPAGVDTMLKRSV